MGLILGTGKVDARKFDGTDVASIDPYYDFLHTEHGSYDLQAHRRVPIFVQKDDSEQQITKAHVRIHVRAYGRDLSNEEMSELLRVVRGGEQNWFVPEQHVSVVDGMVYFENGDTILLSIESTRMKKSEYIINIDFPEAWVTWSSKDKFKIMRMGFWRASYRGKPVSASSIVDPAYIYVRSSVSYLPDFLGESIPIIAKDESTAEKVVESVARSDCPVSAITSDKATRLIYGLAKKAEDELSVPGLGKRGLKAAGTKVLMKVGASNIPAKVTIFFVDALIKASGDKAAFFVCYTWDVAPYRWSSPDLNYVSAVSPSSDGWLAVAAIPIVDRGGPSTGIQLTSVEPIWRIFNKKLIERQFDIEPWLGKDIYSQRPTPESISSRFHVAGMSLNAGTELSFPVLRSYQTGLNVK